MKLGSCEKISAAFQRAVARAIPLALIASSAFVTASCTNGKLGAGLSSLKNAANNSATTASSYYTITNVVRDALNPSGTFDITDDGSGWMNNCTTSTTSGSTQTPCICNYVYNIPSPTNSSVLIGQELQVNTSYAEADEIRCPFSGLPSSVSQVSVSVTVLATNESSNTISFNFNGGSTTALSQISNYSQVLRYTCKDQVYIPNVLDPNSGIYDPVQSESPEYDYPVNFYTTNTGATIAAYAGGASGVPAVTNWNCPANILNPPADFQITLFSSLPLGGTGSQVISGPISNGLANMNAPNQRSTFYLSSTNTGVFSVPVNSYIAPTIVSNSAGSPSLSGGGLPFLGYGAAPIATSNSGTETCPDSTVGIPTGYQWVKVWLFRMALPNRQYIQGQNLAKLNNLGCNPGPWPTPTLSAIPIPATTPEAWEVADCWYKNTNNTPAYFVGPSGVASITTPNAAASPTPAPSGQLANRFSDATGTCFAVTADAYNNSLNGQQLAAGTDTWTADMETNNADPRSTDLNSYDCGNPNIASIANLLGFCNAQPSGSSQYTIFDADPVPGNLDSQQTRYEFLFVVTPTTVNTADMTNTSSAILAQYTPMRWQSNSECLSNTPSAENSGCSSSNSFAEYFLKLHDVTSNGDAPADDPEATPLYPVCAIQPIGLPQ